MYPRTPWDIVGEAWRRHCNLAQVEGVKLPIGDYIWVQGHAAAADGLEDTCCHTFHGKSCFWKEMSRSQKPMKNLRTTKKSFTSQGHIP